MAQIRILIKSRFGGAPFVGVYDTETLRLDRIEADANGASELIPVFLGGSRRDELERIQFAVSCIRQNLNHLSWSKKVRSTIARNVASFGTWEHFIALGLDGAGELDNVLARLSIAAGVENPENY